ncbi:GPW/gp25 family protein [Ohtaekwangia kribbensis]|jgi:phage baseplate assembly protein W|uniref:GPW/gp25 family protein n=1 Tax=Ohtaekwangia kribbensis TaxID=688913 RepID=A0ABW3K340_9BACT
MKAIDKSFLGIGWSYPPTFRREWYGVEMLHEEEDVRSSIHIILSTITGERIMQPTFGCNLQPKLFEVMNVPNIALIEKLVHDALVFHEPRIIVEEVTSEAKQQEGTLLITVQYTIITTNTRYNYVFPFYMNEATNIEHA